jgi:hypothetical protein
MGAIPKSNLPGHRQLHERAIAALERCQELPGVEFKRAGGWEELKWKVIISVLGMGNLRDGGVIVIGVAERGEDWDLTGVGPAQLSTYDVDVIIGQVNKYVSPTVTLNVVQVHHDNKQFIAIHAREFEDTPLVCRRNGPDGVREAQALKEGAVFVRSPGVPRTTRVVSAEQMHELLQLAAEKRARRLLEAAHRIGMVAQKSVRELFEKELAGWSGKGTDLLIRIQAQPHWRIGIRPGIYRPDCITSLSDCFKVVEQSKVLLRGWDFPHLSNRPEEIARAIIGSRHGLRSGPSTSIGGCTRVVNSPITTLSKK